MKRFISKLLVFSIIISAVLTTASYAAENASYYLSSYLVYISKSGNTVSVNYEVEGTRKMDYLGVTEVYLYERPDSNSSWTLVQTFLSSNPTYTSTMLGTNTTFKVDSLTYSGTSTYQYKAYVTVYAEKDGGSDSRNLIVNS